MGSRSAVPLGRHLSSPLAADARPQDRFDGFTGSAGIGRGGSGEGYPHQKPVAIRVDADVLAWLKRQGIGYQTRINKLLREAMERNRRA